MMVLPLLDNDDNSGDNYVPSPEFHVEFESFRYQCVYVNVVCICVCMLCVFCCLLCPPKGIYSYSFHLLLSLVT